MSSSPSPEKDFRGAAYHGDVAKLERLHVLGVDINGVDGEGRSACHYACVSGKEEAVSFLVSVNADLSKKDSRGVTPLLLAVGKGHFHCALLLLKGGATQDATVCQSLMDILTFGCLNLSS
jgi:ankyrin repeat protein